MVTRSLFGLGAVGLLGWQVADPPGAYAAFYEVVTWGTDLVVPDDGWWLPIHKILELILVDQALGFFSGVAVTALIGFVLWPFVASGRWGARKVRRIVSRRNEPPEEESILTLDPEKDAPRPDLARR